MKAQSITFTGVIIPPKANVTFTLMAIVNANAPTGKLTNQAYLTDPSNGKVVSNVATATIERSPEHVFDCSDVIGKVFDDENHNGYQDQGEPGLAGVRVVTVNGTRITTDEHGRYHVPCAELPSKIGSNFILKVDARSLPTGYRLTSENPRVERLTAGKFAKMNFGASISNVVRIDLNRKAFTQDGQITNYVQGYLVNLIDEMENKPSVVRLTYVFNDGQSEKVAQKLVKVVDKFIRKEWRKKGQYKLNIERTIKQRSAAGGTR